MEVEKVFDRARTNGHENCSIKYLQELCLVEPLNALFPDGKDDKLLVSIDNCYSKYEEVLPVEIRNKMMAHHDFERILEFKESLIFFEEVKDLVTQSVTIIEKIGERITSFACKLPSMKFYVNAYRDAIKAIVSDS